MQDQTAVAKSLRRACDVFLKDLEALPDDAFDKRFGGKARTVADIVYEVCLVNDDIARSVRGEPMSEWPEGWVIAPSDLRSKQAVVDNFSRSSSEICDLFDNWNDTDLQTKLTTEHGETDRAERGRFATLHLWYHSGQLNFIQTLLGDDDWHWG